MKENIIVGKSIAQWISEKPLLEDIIATKEVFWRNVDYGMKQEELLHFEAINDAAERLIRFAPYIAKAFPETAEQNGLIESQLIPIPNMQRQLEKSYNTTIDGKLLLKCDNSLPISGSIKARGGIYEVLKHAEKLALQYGLLKDGDDYSVLNLNECKAFFSQYSIAVGSTGNLGLSIGIISAKLGFHVTVHMSADAKQWKKDLLRGKGVDVIEYASDYSIAVEEGRKQALQNSNCHFIDDENSIDLFLGYAVAASRLKKQLEEKSIIVDENHPLFVYLPCGVGGGPGGITFGLKAEFGEHVHCFFVEPTHSPCFLLGQLTGLQDQVSVQDFGIDNVTEADGLAVGRISRFVGRAIGHHVSGCYTVQDKRLFTLLRFLADQEKVNIEPSASAALFGPVQLLRESEGLRYIQKHHLQTKMVNSHHIVWATGGNMVPKEVMKEYYCKDVF
ncbi:D-serine ammonia-lyase [Bacillus sp. JJ722]|uniref:D-serine ammonia-lyase n=1 Tax=Bacillus sp. JJ722 TaxID=3122973 RepID=UPI002FFE69FF